MLFAYSHSKNINFEYKYHNVIVKEYLEKLYLEVIIFHNIFSESVTKSAFRQRQNSYIILY